MDTTVKHGGMDVTLDEKFEIARQWLRYHSDYTLTLSWLWVGATCRVEFMHRNTTVLADRGKTVAKRIDKVLRAMAEIHDCADWGQPIRWPWKEEP